MNKNFSQGIYLLIPLFLAGFFIYMAFFFAHNDSSGQNLYNDRCANCHGDQGEGIQLLVPPLWQADFAKKNLDSIPCWITQGMNHPILVNGKNYDQPMYPLKLDAVQIANIINFLNEKFFENKIVVSPKWVDEKLQNCKGVLK